MNAEEPMDMSEVQVCGNTRGSRVEDEPPRVDNGEFGVSRQVSEEVVEPFLTSIENHEGQGVPSNDQFQEKIKEIDEDLAKFDSFKSGDPSTFLSDEQHITHVWMEHHQVKDAEEECEVPRSLIRGWKRLLRIREVSLVEPPINQSKRRVQEILEEDDDLVP